MQTSILPATTCEAIDKRIRSFIWGSSDLERKVHLISWERICQPKHKGGFGLKSARLLNRAYMMKLAFLFFQKEEPLWIRILQSKYFKEVRGGMIPRHLSSQSAVWKGLTAEWNTMLQGSMAVIRNGRDTNFWTTHWLDKDNHLLEFASGDLTKTELQEVVANYATDDGEWNFKKIRILLLVEGLELVMGMSPPKSDRGADGWAWGGETDGKFSIKTAYSLLNDQLDGNNDQLWKTIWRWKGPNRVKHFLWLAGQDRLLTNQQWFRRNLSSDHMCPLCLNQVENSIHILRECGFAKEVWRGTNRFDMTDNCWTSLDEVWLTKMLSSSHALDFGIICWSLWKARNARYSQLIIRLPQRHLFVLVIGRVSWKQPGQEKIGT
ncbi:Putative ribonuclease H protein At1g65750 [Linum perenne]